MAHNTLAPHFVRLYYTSGSTPHVQTLQCSLVGPVSPGDEPDVSRRSAAAIPISEAITAYVDIIKAFFRSVDTFTGYEVFGVDMETNDPFFIYGDDLTTVGTNAGATLLDGQGVFTFGTALGGVLKLYLMEPVTAQNQRTPLKTTAIAPLGTLATYMLGANAWIRGRDDSFPIRGIYYTSKINDMLRKKTLLDQ